MTPPTLSTPVSEITFTVLDIETTGLNPQIDAIIEIGAVRVKAQKIQAEFNTLIQTEAGVRNTAVEINRITAEMLAGQPRIADALPEFVSFLKDTVLVGHNIQNFDLPFIRANLARLSIPPLYNHIVDTYILAQRILPNEPHYSLQELANSLVITQQDAHRALDDAITCSKIFHKIIDEMSFMGDAPPLSDLIG